MSFLITPMVSRTFFSMLRPSKRSRYIAFPSKICTSKEQYKIDRLRSKKFRWQPYTTTSQLTYDENEKYEISGKQERRNFADLDLNQRTLQALAHQGLVEMTEIQEKTFDVVVSGRDVVGRARTGTGKTISFLVPALERVVRKHDKGMLPSGISILVLSPTRELAAQISKEAGRLVGHHGPEITSQVVFGGSSRYKDIQLFEKRLPTVLVATPGRIKDHLASTRLHGKVPFVDALQNLQILILDETDRLLDMGFRKDVQQIMSFLPRKRQTLLFSATLPQDVKDVIEIATNPTYEMVDCIGDEDPATQTNKEINQSYVALPTEQFWTKSMEYLLDLSDRPDRKAMVFFPMTSMVELYAQLFNMRFGRRVLELHGKMQQRERTTISRRFRKLKKGLLFTSDVSARGIDYPDVTHVVQIGACGSKETYIHRLGRTGRAGKKGEGILIIPEVEKNFLNELDGLDLTNDSKLNSCLVHRPPSKKILNELGPIAQKIRAGGDAKIETAIHDAYQAMLPYYFQNCSDKHGAIALVNRLVDVMGLAELPAIDRRRAQKLKLTGLPGVNVKTHWNEQNWQGAWGSGNRSSSPSRVQGFNGISRSNSKQPSHQFSDFDASPSKDRKRSNQIERRQQRAKQFQESFIKVGWKKDDATGTKSTPLLKKNKNAPFQRWSNTKVFKVK